MTHFVPTPIRNIRVNDWVVITEATDRRTDVTGTFRVSHIIDQEDDDSVVIELDAPGFAHWSGYEPTVTVPYGALVEVAFDDDLAALDTAIARMDRRMQTAAELIRTGEGEDAFVQRTVEGRSEVEIA